MHTEDEQVEKLKSWLKENGMSIVLGIVIGVGGLSGYRYWVHVQETTAAEASSHFTALLAALEAGDAATVQARAETLRSEYDGTEYAMLAQLALARQQVEAGEFERAAQTLEQVAAGTAQNPLGYVARLRLAAIQLELDRLDAALGTLAVDFPDEFAARVEELRGDVLSRQGNADAAAEAYRKAQRAEPGPADAEFLRQKLTDLGIES